MIASSSIIGLIGIAISYLIAIPLGSYMALFKNSWFDSISTAALTFMMSLPTIASVYIVRLAGSFFGLPDSFPVLGAQDWRSYVLPSLILGLLSAPFNAVWIRRYMIDIHSQDFVRFARSKGLSEREISKNTSSKMRWFHWYLVFRHLLLELSQVRHLLKQSSLSQVWVKC